MVLCSAAYCGHVQLHVQGWKLQGMRCMILLGVKHMSLSSWPSVIDLVCPGTEHWEDVFVLFCWCVSCTLSLSCWGWWSSLSRSLGLPLSLSPLNRSCQLSCKISPFHYKLIYLILMLLQFFFFCNIPPLPNHNYLTLRATIYSSPKTNKQWVSSIISKGVWDILIETSLISWIFYAGFNTVR